MKTKELTLVAMMTSLTVILAQLSIPIGTVPITLSILSVYLGGALLGRKLGTLSIILYILLGTIGLPVFANFKGGIQVLFGPTGGYLFGYIIATYIVGMGYQIFSDNLKKDYFSFILLSIIGLVVIYLLGVTQLKYVLNFTWNQAYAAGIKPFIVLDILKIIVAGMVVIPLRSALLKSNLLPFRGVSSNG